MNASYDWLRAFVEVDTTPPQLRDLLTAHAATVEELVSLRTDLAPIVVGRVVEAGRHPDSDHLWVTKVDAGGGELLEVICGAPNVTAGKLYPFAPTGTTMPNGMKIEKRKIRGIVSNGMLCSSRELGLGDDHEGILELKTEAAPGTRFLSIMPVGDTRLVIDVGANRPDLLSHLGIAREISAVTGKKWQLPEIPGLGKQTPKPKKASGSGETGGIRVRVEADSKTRRYLGAVVRGVKIGPSPEWMVRRLEGVGVRSINNVVDATNYVLHELGQPVHAFDAARIGGNEIIVRKARPNETTVTLDGVSRKLTPDTVVIADATQSQGIAGVMGGRDSEVSDTTQDLFIEVANFDPKLIRAARKAAGLNTDASYRFERGVDREIAPVALDRVVRIIIALAGGSLDGAPIDVATPAPKVPTIKLRASRVAQVLGVSVSLKTAAKYLMSAGFKVAPATTKEMKVTVPSWRGDVTEEIDLVEEVARFHGYDKLPDEIRPFRPTTTFDDPLWTQAARVREALIALGLLESHPVPFVAGASDGRTPTDAYVRVANPIAETEAFLRLSLFETLVRSAEYNLAQRTGDVRLFEIGSVFARGDAAMPREELRVGVLVMGRRRPPHFTEPQPPNYDEWDAKAIAEVAIAAAHPGKPFQVVPMRDGKRWEIRVEDRSLGVVGPVTLDAPVWAAPAFGIEFRLAHVQTDPPAERGKHAYMEGARPGRAAPRKYAPLPTMPPAEIDLALLVPDGTTVADVERVIRASSGELLERLELFDQYTGSGVESGHRSLAWRLTFRHPERTLRDKEIEGRASKVLGALKQELNVRQR